VHPIDPAIQGFHAAAAHTMTLTIVVLPNTIARLLTRHFSMLAVFLSVLFACEATGYPVLIRESDAVAVYAEAEAVLGAETVFRLYPEIKAELEDRLQLAMATRTVTVVLQTARGADRKEGGSVAIIAVALPEVNRIVIDYPAVLRHPFSLRAVLKHELCHLLLHAAVPANALPRWLDEGIAQWVSDGVGELMITDDAALLNKALLSERALPLSSLAHEFPASRELLPLAYAESRSFVEYLAARFGAASIPTLLGHLSEGKNVQLAFIETFSESLAELERGWKSSLHQENLWFTWLARHLYELLFIVGALLTIAGFVRFLRRRGQYDAFE